MSDDETPAYRAQTGPDHYLDAEQWLRYAEDAYSANEDPAVALAAATIAQGHAQLAQAAAQAVFTAGLIVETIAEQAEGDSTLQELEQRAEKALSSRDAAVLGWFDAGVVR